MAEQNLIDRLDAAVDAILAGRREGLAAAEPELAALLVIAGDLAALPDPAFKARLRNELVPKEEGMPVAESIGVQTVVPYLVVDGAERLIRFMTDAFGAEERFKVKRPDGSVMHAVMALGDATVELADIREGIEPTKSAIHFYVPDVDAMFSRALAAGATALYPLTDQPYGDREGSVRDDFGNHWYLATHIDPAPLPAGFGNVIPYLHVAGAGRQIQFLTRALGAAEIERTPGADGTIMHASYRIGESTIELSEAHGQWGPMPMHFHVYVDDPDAAYARAIAAGASSIFEPATMPYGERMGAVADAAGNQWYLAKKVVSS